MVVSKDAVVTMSYVLTNTRGEVLDASGDEPFHYLHGHENIVPGLERALEGLAVGASKEADVLPEDGYGDYDPQLKFDLPSAQLGKEMPPVDAMVSLRDSSGQRMIARVVKVTAESVTLDANHPLAGETLRFAVTITGVRAASADELAHGHVHGPGCHHH